MTALWYALRSKPNKEDFLAKQLEAYDVDVFFPRIHVKPVNPRSRKTRPYFPNYLFVHVDFCKRPNIGHMVMTLNHCISSSYSLTWHKNHEWGRGSAVYTYVVHVLDLEFRPVLDSWCSTIYSRRARIFLTFGSLLSIITDQFFPSFRPIQNPAKFQIGHSIQIKYMRAKCKHFAHIWMRL